MMENRIPQRIIQTGKTRDLPLKARAAVCNLTLLNPDFEYLFFDDAQVVEFIDREFPEYRKTFDSFRFPIQRFDFFRYLAVYHFGGFYFDLDVFLASNLSSLLGSGCVFPFEGLTFSSYLRSYHGMDWQIGNYAFGAVAGHPFLRAVIENCVKAQMDAGWVEPMMSGIPRFSRAEFFVLNTTGPGLLSRTLAESGSSGDSIEVLFPDDVCDVTKWNQFGEMGAHLMEGSWRLRSGFLQGRLAMYWEDREMRKLLRQSRALGPTRALAQTPRG